MKEGEIKTATDKAIEAKRKASDKPRFVKSASAFDGEGYNLLFMENFEFITGRKTPKY